MSEYKGIFSNEQTRDTYEFLLNSGSYMNRQLSHCKTPKEVKYLCIDNWQEIPNVFLNKINFDEIFELVTRG